MNSVTLRNCRIGGVERPTEVWIENGFIAGDAPPAGESIDLGGAALFPGFVDIHNHGAMGVDVNEADADGLFAIGEYLARRGVTTWTPTFVPDSDEVYRRVTAAIDEVMAMQASRPVAQIAGVHYEGVFANTQMCGALRPEFFKTFTGGEVGELPRLKRGAHLTTLAPEIEGGIELVAELRRQGWIPSIGHTKADAPTLARALAAGALHVTHLFNAMTGVHHRDLGVAGWALTTDEISCEIIADGIHVRPEILKLAAAQKPADKLLLVSDSAAPTGLGDGEFELWGEKITVENGRTRNERGSIAGSVITSLDAVRTYLGLGLAPERVALMASTNPARLLGLADRGEIRPGLRADLVALDAGGEVVMSMIGGLRVDE